MMKLLCRLLFCILFTGAAAPTAAVKIARQEVAAHVYELAWSARHQQVFVMAPMLSKDNGAEKTSQIIWLNGETLAVEGAADLPVAGFGGVLDDISNTLYIGTREASVIAWDTVTHRIKGVLQLAEKQAKEGEARPTHFLRQLWFDGTNQRLYVPGIAWGESVLYVIDARTFKLLKTLPSMGLMATGIVQAPDGGDIFITNWQNGLIVVDSKTLTVKKRYPLPVDQPLYMAYNAGRNELLVVDEGLEDIYNMLEKGAAKEGRQYQRLSGGNRLIAINPQTGEISHTLTTGTQPVAVKVDNRSGRVYVTSRSAGSVSIYSAQDYRLLESVVLKPLPNSIAIDERRGTAYISVKNESRGEDKEQIARLDF